MLRIALLTADPQAEWVLKSGHSVMYVRTVGPRALALVVPREALNVTGSTVLYVIRLAVGAVGPAGLTITVPVRY